MCIYTYIYTHIHTHIHTHIYIYIYIYIYMYMNSMGRTYNVLISNLVVLIVTTVL